LIPHSRPRFGPDYRQAVEAVLAAGHPATGEVTERLERQLAERLERKRAVAVDSGTSAITLALRALRQECRIVQVGIPAYCCSSVLFAVRAAGMNPVLLDCGEDLRLHAASARERAASLDAVVLVHPFGMVEPLAGEAWPGVVIEDIAQAAGAELGGRPLGSFGDVAVASFHATKPWGGAYGGAVACNETELAAAIVQMRSSDRTDAEWPEYAGHHQLSDLHAALVLQRMADADTMAAERKRRAAMMYAWFAGKASGPVMRDGNDFRYIVRTPGKGAETIASLYEHGVCAARPVPALFPGEQLEECPGALAAWRDCVSLPLLADFTDEEFSRMEEAVRTCMP